jgi:hypothetical protein
MSLTSNGRMISCEVVAANQGELEGLRRGKRTLTLDSQCPGRILTHHLLNTSPELAPGSHKMPQYFEHTVASYMKAERRVHITTTDLSCRCASKWKLTQIPPRNHVETS